MAFLHRFSFLLLLLSSLFSGTAYGYAEGMSKTEQINYIKNLNRYTREALIADFSLTFTKDGSWPPGNATYVATDGQQRDFWPDVKQISGHDWETALQCWRNHKKTFHHIYARDIAIICRLNADKGFKKDIGIHPPNTPAKKNLKHSLGFLPFQEQRGSRKNRAAAQAHLCKLAGNQPNCRAPSPH